MDAAAPDNEKTTARRRWRNMMIAAMAGYQITPKRREHLEKIRQQLGISIEEAREIVDEYRSFGGKITLFGDRFQRLQVFRDIISMLLAGGELDDKGHTLLQLMAQRLEIDPPAFEQYLAEARSAFDLSPDPENARVSQRLSRRIFRRIVSHDAEHRERLKGFDTLPQESRRDLELQILEDLVRAEIPRDADKESLRMQRQRLTYLEDQRCLRALLEMRAVTEEQVRPFRERQAQRFEADGGVTSFLTEMAKADLLSREMVDNIRARIRAEHPEEQEADERWEKRHGLHSSELTLQFRALTLDHTFRASLLILAGSLDQHTADGLHNELQTLFARKDDASRMFILELSGLKHLSSAGVGVILNAHAKALDRWGAFRFVNPSPEAREIFQLIGIDQVVTTCKSVREALWSFVDTALE